MLDARLIQQAFSRLDDVLAFPPRFGNCRPRSLGGQVEVPRSSPTASLSD